MWAYQPHFRISVKVRAESTLEAIGFTGNPDVVLVGFKATGEHEFDVCIEPEDGPYSPDDLEQVRQRAVDLYNNHPDRDMIHSVAHVHEQRHRGLRDRMRAQALEEAFEAMPKEQGRKFFSSRSVRVDDYEVHVVISIDNEALRNVPQIKTEERDRFPVYQSLVHAVIREVLGRSARYLFIPDAGSGPLPEGTDEIVRSATEAMVRSMLYCAGFWFGSENHLLMSGLSALPYEGRPGAGRLVIAKQNDPAIEVFLRLKHPVKMRNVPAVRKLLEASGSQSDLLSDGESVYGLGVVKPDYDDDSETVFAVSFTARGVWEFSHAGEALLTVRDGIPHLPAHALDEEYFQDLLNRFFPEADQNALREAAQAAGNHRHGAMLIISGDAASEAERLSPQSWSIEPTRLTSELLTQLTDMDGAMLVDPQGRCHAIGVILDGTAHGRGDPARGSRFNNAIRYLDSDRPPAIVVVYSSDGVINILPQLHPRIEKQIVIDAVERYLAAASVESLSLKECNEAWDAVKSLRFYLSSAQCEALNRTRVRVDKWEEQNRNLRIIKSDLEPDPEMDDSYWL
ncbi:DNA integrity scanning protein DisA nucleotide-binding domain protein [Streptomyces sp. NPDC058451]|uniref:DNA integrity scanning protein DisA nucleotide-binding domain protein n=1 Tax=Streptomyces sp. NPDC058451 TaxID=3346506 RepID=UPI00365D037E